VAKEAEGFAVLGRTIRPGRGGCDYVDLSVTSGKSSGGGLINTTACKFAGHAGHVFVGHMFSKWLCCNFFEATSCDRTIRPPIAHPASRRASSGAAPSPKGCSGTGPSRRRRGRPRRKRSPPPPPPRQPRRRAGRTACADCPGHGIRGGAVRGCVEGSKLADDGKDLRSANPRTKEDQPLSKNSSVFVPQGCPTTEGLRRSGLVVNVNQVPWPARDPTAAAVGAVGGRRPPGPHAVPVVSRRPRGARRRAGRPCRRRRPGLRPARGQGLHWRWASAWLWAKRQ